MATRAGDRHTTGRLAFSWAAGNELVLGVAVSVALVLATRLPLRTRYLLNWDAAQFALGLQHFDLAHHQPHPPGYLGYLALGRLAQLLLPDPNQALTLLSILGECAAVGLGFFFAYRLFGLFSASVTALAMATSPLFWYYGEAANTYALEPLFALLVGWFCWRLWKRDATAAYPAAIALAAAGAVRPSTMVLLSPLFVAGLRRATGLRQTLLTLAAGALAVAAWAVPLVALSGGPMRYLQVGLQLGESVTASTAFWIAGLTGLLVTGEAVTRAVVWELCLFAFIALFGLVLMPLLVGRRPPLPSGWGTFTLFWVAPGLLTFLLIHIGQLVYVQVFLPALMLVLGPAVLATARSLRRISLAPAVVGLGVTVNLLTFFLPARYSLAGQLRLHDERVAQTISLVSAQDPNHTVLISWASGAGSYRTAQVYLPAYPRVAVGQDREGRLGEIYGDSYDLTGFERARPLQLPPAANVYVFLDKEVITDYVADPERLKQASLADGSRLFFWSGPPPRLESGELWLGDPYRELRGFA